MPTNSAGLKLEPKNSLFLMKAPIEPDEGGPGTKPGERCSISTCFITLIDLCHHAFNEPYREWEGSFKSSRPNPNGLQMRKPWYKKVSCS